MNSYLANREPALLATVAGIAIKLVAAYWLPLTTEQQALLNAAVAAGLGLAVAAITKDGLSAGILGVAQAFIALAIGLGLRLDPETQAMVMSAIAGVIGMYERTQVTAPAPPPPDAKVK